MGCFNQISCVSKLPIYCSEKIAFFFMFAIPRKSISETIDQLSGFRNVYYPLCPPIIGEYDEYGRVMNIERDKNVENLEKIFGKNIDDLVIDLHYQYNTDDYAKFIDQLKLPKGSVMFTCMEHYDVYKRIATTGKWFYNWDESWRISKRYRGMFTKEGYGFSELRHDVENFTEEQKEVYNKEYKGLYESEDEKDWKKLPTSYEKLFKMSDYQQPKDAVLSTNINPLYEVGVFEKYRDVYPLHFMWIYKMPVYAEMLWDDGMREPYTTAISFYHGLFDLQLELVPSRYGRQQHNDIHMKKLYDVYNDIVNRHYDETVKLREERDEYDGWSKDMDDFDE